MYSLTVLWHQLLGALLLPPLIYLLPIVLGALLLRRCRLWGSGLLALGVVLGYLLSIPQTAMWLARHVERYPVASAAQLQAVEAIVVLGGGKKPAPEYGRNEPGADTLARLRYGAYLARQTGKPLLVTGGAPLGGEPEGEVMARTLREDYGLTPRWVESRSNTTLENAQFSAALLRRDHVQRIALVSQGWHLARAVPFFERQGLSVLPAPTGFIRYDGGGVFWWIPGGRAQQECHSLLREYLGQLFYSVRKDG
ncbi:YdcF family protein [Chromobacterium phragmitis]|uniref:YdcF family protein n=1 Tax=Chromobacterium amazonense TaxID=1382803 RepID=UPI000582DA4B|nr:YdcF family protein [Chromobacterium amazonense]KIA79080.1 membrane protein [Chromobacterium piscinae]MBM2883280.1 YdcF family protein [Chromobacterium amazonense]